MLLRASPKTRETKKRKRVRITNSNQPILAFFGTKSPDHDHYHVSVDTDVKNCCGSSAVRHRFPTLSRATRPQRRGPRRISNECVHRIFDDDGNRHLGWPLAVRLPFIEWQAREADMCSCSAPAFGTMLPQSGVQQANMCLLRLPEL